MSFNPDVTIFSSGKWYKHITGINNRIKELLLLKDMQDLPQPEKDGLNRVRSEDSRILIEWREWFLGHIDHPVYRLVLRPVINYIIAKLDYDRHAAGLAKIGFKGLVDMGWGKNIKPRNPYWKENGG